MNAPSPRIPAAADPEVLKTLASVLADLGGIGQKLQEMIGSEFRTGKLGADAIMDAQAADLLVQYLHEISKFLGNYSAALLVEDADPLAAATSTLLLGGLVGRLMQSCNSAVIAAVADGDIEMF